MDAVDTADAVTRVFAGALQDARFRAVPLDDGLLATDLADRLVRDGVPFRRAHETVAAAVRRCEALDLPLLELPAGEWRRLGAPEAAVAGLSAEEAVESRAAVGGTSRARVRQQLGQARRWLAGRRRRNGSSSRG